jgi:arylsulfatase A-like enzyme
MPEILSKHKVYSHLISDHQHYWEDGGCTYHHRYDSWEIVRGQEGDKWKGQVKDPEIPEHLGMFWRQDAVNRSYMRREEDQSQTQVFKLGLEFLETNKDADNWFLHLETFDPHEPFFTMQNYKDLYPHQYGGPHFDWPFYGPVTEGEVVVEHLRYQYAALLSMCDASLGKLLDVMDRHDLWKDTMLIVNTDHGYLLAEHERWAKGDPWHEELVHTPFFVWDPRCGIKGERRQALVQTIDIAPTLLDFFSLDIPPDMQGKPVKGVLEKDEPIHEGLLFGTHGHLINVTDGRYVYMRDSLADNKPLYEYTHMPTHMRMRFTPEEMRTMALAPPFSFTKGAPLMRIDVILPAWQMGQANPGTRLYDLEKDPGQLNPINDPAIERRMIQLMVKLMKENDAPVEQYERMGFDRSVCATP